MNKLKKILLSISPITAFELSVIFGCSIGVVLENIYLIASICFFLVLRTIGLLLDIRSNTRKTHVIVFNHKDLDDEDNA